MTFFINIWARNVVIRYAAAGVSASGLEVILLFVFTEFFHIYYLVSAVIAMTISFFARFALQKLLAFKDSSAGKIHAQLLFYSILYLGSMVSTAGLLYLFVEKLHVWYIFAQMMTIIIIAAVSFFVYRHVIFPQRQTI